MNSATLLELAREYGYAKRGGLHAERGSDGLWRVHRDSDGASVAVWYRRMLCPTMPKRLETMLDKALASERIGDIRQTVIDTSDFISSYRAECRYRGPIFQSRSADVERLRRILDQNFNLLPD